MNNTHDVSPSLDVEDLLFELRTEELPALSQALLSSFLCERISQLLESQGFLYQKIQSFVTPTRLVLYGTKVHRYSQPQKISKRGPLLTAPLAAVEGFAKSCGVLAAALSMHKTHPQDEARDAKAEPSSHYYFHSIESGRDLFSLLAESWPAILAAIPFPKTMRWGEQEQPFLRPVHGLVALYGAMIIPLTLWGKTSDRLTRGHRMMAPQPFSIPCAQDYFSLIEQAYIDIDREQRMQNIVQQVQNCAKSYSAIPLLPQSLLEELSGIVERPYILVVPFDAQFLSLPQDILVTVMQQHQRYIALEQPASHSDHNRLLPYCIVIVQQAFSPEDAQIVIMDHQRVLHARFSDAVFFYEQDLKHPLEDYSALLKKLVFHEKLGSVFNKVEKLMTLSTWLRTQLDPLGSRSSASQVQRAALLSKSDLCTKIVQEFPELQGIMGQHYAQKQGEDPSVCLALWEQYSPKNAHDPALPSSIPGICLALSDRLLTLVGIFSQDLRPTGNKDPFALRRAMLAVLRISIASALPCSLSELFAQSVQLYTQADKPEKTQQDLLFFAQERFIHEYTSDQTEQSYPKVMVLGILEPHLAQDSPALLLEKIRILDAFQKNSQALALAQAHKRVLALLKHPSSPYAAELLRPKTIEQTLDLLSPIEKALQGVEHTLQQELYRVLWAIKPQIEGLENKSASVQEGYQHLLQELIHLLPCLDQFFEQVLVMDEDMAIRHRRLALIAAFHYTALFIGDISCLCALCSSS